MPYPTYDPGPETGRPTPRNAVMNPPTYDPGPSTGGPTPRNAVMPQPGFMPGPETGGPTPREAVMPPGMPGIMPSQPMMGLGAGGPAPAEPGPQTGGLTPMQDSPLSRGQSPNRSMLARLLMQARGRRGVRY
jgi:hypothetical protein